ncbi:ABC transporter permease [Pelobium manganitolerans]|uniref:ABC transporter permease n=1 Tax=Pelobium manganitolerans TaxID=1842495 RepID=A0A419S2Q8_9SPHI|nr:cytochrome c biogenesis protein CcsA [Pelobium manganitolerans]RKD13268.1 ABC transporter permease [Pelobium manganitolerans]
MSKNWWKVLASVFVLYSVVAGLLFKVPTLPILHESIRNLYYHVPMWFAMVVIYSVAVYYSIRYLQTGDENHDLVAVEAVNTGLVFGLVGLASGMVWANYTWGAPWPNDPKLNSAAIATLLYFAYTVLRSSLDEEQKRAKIAAIYNIFAYPIMVVLLFVLPRLTDSLHPGNGGNPGFGAYDLDSNMRFVFYPAVLGWIGIAVWIVNIRYRIRKIENKRNQI